MLEWQQGQTVLMERTGLGVTRLPGWVPCTWSLWCVLGAGDPWVLLGLGSASIPTSWPNPSLFSWEVPLGSVLLEPQDCCWGQKGHGTRG